MSVTEAAVPTVQWDQLYVIINLMPGPIDGFDKQGNPRDKRGKVLSQRESQKFVLQHGRIFDEAGQLAEKVPPRVREQVTEMQAKHPQPGITHEGRVRRCPVPGCPFARSKEEQYQAHKRLHKDISAEQWARLEGGTAPVQTINLSDFKDPGQLLHQFTEGAGAAEPVRESAQGDG